MTTTNFPFAYTGAAQSFVVPTGVTSVVVTCVGGAGAPFAAVGGGFGATVAGTLAVTPGETLQINVGGGGSAGVPATNTVGVGGVNGGGYGGLANAAGGYSPGAGGGGASDVRQGGTALANRKIMAGGGGGGTAGGGGGGGGALGGNGLDGNGTTGDKGHGGTQSAGGAGGNLAQAGVSGVGGNAPFNGAFDGPGGGGGGFFGGGAGGYDTGTGANNSGGGGGSSNAAGCTSTSSTAGTTAGNTTNALNGSVNIAVVDSAPTAPTLTLPLNGGFVDVANTVLGWTFNDPDTGSGDTQSSVDIRYRPVGVADWNTIPNAVFGAVFTYLLTGLTVGQNYEWQIRTYDAQQVVGPYSASFFFTVKLHPVVTILTPASGAPITSLAGQSFTINQVRDQSGATFRRVADSNGQPDTSTVYETITLGSASLTSYTFTSTSHNNGPEHWQVQVQTFSGQIISDWQDVYVVMSVNAPATPTVVATAVPASGAIQVKTTLAEGSVDYFSALSLPTVADTGQALTNTGTAPFVSGGYLANNAGQVSGQQMTLAGKVLSMQCSFRQNTLGSTHNNGLSLVAIDGSNNAHIYCGIDAQHWYIKLDTAGSVSTLSSGVLTTAIVTPTLNGYPWAMSVTISGTTVSFTDPWGVVHTATNASIGTFTGHIAWILITSGTASGDDTWKVAHWSASSTAANNAAYGYVSRSIDGANFVPIPASVWEAQELGAVYNYTDNTPPFNRRVWYQATAITAAGAIAQSAVS